LNGVPIAAPAQVEALTHPRETRAIGVQIMRSTAGRYGGCAAAMPWNPGGP
jgi:hypothetical protein